MRLVEPDPRQRLPWTKAWLATLFDAGYAGPSWPREFGGMELSFAHQVIYHEEAARARVPGPLGTGLNKLDGKVFRIGHLGWLNEIMVLQALGGVELAMRDVGITFEPGSGVGAA